MASLHRMKGVHSRSGGQLIEQAYEVGETIRQRRRIEARSRRRSAVDHGEQQCSGRRLKQHNGGHDENDDLPRDAPRQEPRYPAKHQDDRSTRGVNR
jgi:hypothetical protein